MDRRILTVGGILLALVGCRGPAFNVPPSYRLMEPGPGVGGPGPGVLTAADYSGWPVEDGIACGDSGGFLDPQAPMPTVQVVFADPSGMRVYWDVTGTAGFDGPPLVTPGRTNFDQSGLYRCKLTNIPGHEGVELYPTIEIGTPTPYTLAYVSHNAIPIQLTADDFNQVTAGNFVTKVIYLPDPDFQHLAVAGVETLVSTRLDPGVDPVVEADRRGSIMAIVRIGNKDIEMPGTDFNEVYSATLNDRGEIAPVSFQSAVRRGIGPSPPPAAFACGAPYAGVSGPTPAMSGVMPGWSAMSVPPGVSAAMQNTYGLPHTGTPIGLPGPPHIPLGGPAGLKRHVIANHTATYMPDPTNKVKIHVKQSPPVSYPAPRSRAYVHQYDHPNCAHCIGSAP